MTRLSVNINKLATLRNARGGQNPDVIRWAQDIERFGAQGITIHPRPDERHITRADVYALKKVVSTEFNIEGYPSDEFMDMVLEVGPDQVTLVPDPPEVLTSNAGWKVFDHEELLRKVIREFKAKGIRVSLFMENDLEGIKHTAALGADRIELYTEAFARAVVDGEDSVLEEYVQAAEVARDSGLGVNAGHDLDLNNLPILKAAIPYLDEVSIGHALICDALRYGMENTINLYLRALRDTES
ncbi:MAG: pyridoxine 5'-phosphate synthase [Flavobacteriales bacterium]|nr:pyridoxine 5'-phosphate synthase [Flavobacteriales bacterium]